MGSWGHGVNPIQEMELMSNSKAGIGIAYLKKWIWN